MNWDTYVGERKGKQCSFGLSRQPKATFYLFLLQPVSVASPINNSPNSTLIDLFCSFFWKNSKIAARSPISIEINWRGEFLEVIMAQKMVLKDLMFGWKYCWSGIFAGNTAGYLICSFSGFSVTISLTRYLPTLQKLRQKEDETFLPSESISTHYRPIFFTAQWAFFKSPLGYLVHYCTLHLEPSYNRRAACVSAREGNESGVFISFILLLAFSLPIFT